MKIISESVIKSNTGKTFAVKKGQIISVVGQSTADYVVFNLHNVKERFDQEGITFAGGAREVPGSLTRTAIS